MSAFNDEVQSLRNPDTYLNHLPFDDARNYEICRNITLVVLGITLWDILVYMPDDIGIIKRSRFRSPIICFAFARIFAASYLFCSVIRSTTPLDNQVGLLYAALTLSSLAVACSSYLFLRRVHAVYMDNPWVQWFFSALWLASIACEVSIFVGIAPSNIPGTHYFKATGAKPTFTISMYGGVTFDTSVFLAISYKIASSFTAGERFRWSTIVSGRALPRLSRAILHGGQQYYLIAVGMMLTAVTLLLMPSVHPIIKGTFVIPLVPLSASMACRVFRNLKQFDYRATSTDLPMSHLRF